MIRAPGSTATPPGTAPHVSVCICTYKRPELLLQSLAALAVQDTGGRFTYAVVVADNDHRESARTTVSDYAALAPMTIRYFVEPRQNISLARNKAVENAGGDFIAFLDDDEAPAPDWLLRLLEAIELYQADGVLGPVIPRFQRPPPEWIVRGKFFERPSPPSGTWLRWKETRTGNVLLRRTIFDEPGNLFRPECGHGGEDVDFFRRMTTAGMRFAWCAEAKVYEFVPVERCRRGYLLERALLRGRALHNRGWPVAVSLVAAPAYAVALPVLPLFGQHVFMRYLIKECDHVGRILAAVVRTITRAQ